MGDAVALFHPANPERLRPFLDLDDESETSEGIYAEALEDGSFLLFTFQPFEIFAENGDEARAWLAQFGDAFDDVHDDPRGVLFFPDQVEPDGQTYDAVVDEVGEAGIFVAPVAMVLPTTSFEIGQMLESVQEKLFESFGRALANEPNEEDDET